MTNFEEKDGFIWMDGEFVDWSQAKVHVLTHTLHYGLGVFEGVRAYLTDEGTKIFRLEDHTNRLFESAEAVNMKIPFSKEQLNDVQKEIFKVNNLIPSKRHNSSQVVINAASSSEPYVKPNPEKALCVLV